MIDNEQDARDYVAALCDADAMVRLDRFVALLTAENERQNLVSKGSLTSVWQRHVADSAQLLDIARKPRNWLDLGTGAGFPGLVIAVMRPQLPIALVESRRLRIDWLNHMVTTLGLNNCTVMGAKLESVESAPYSVISARAFAPLPRLIELAERFSTNDTVWLLPKGRSAAQEVAEVPRRVQLMFHVEQSVTDPEAGVVVAGIKKAAHS